MGEFKSALEGTTTESLKTHPSCPSSVTLTRRSEPSNRQAACGMSRACQLKGLRSTGCSAPVASLSQPTNCWQLPFSCATLSSFCWKVPRHTAQTSNSHDSCGVSTASAPPAFKQGTLTATPPSTSSSPRSRNHHHPHPHPPSQLQHPPPRPNSPPESPP